MKKVSYEGVDSSLLNNTGVYKIYHTYNPDMIYIGSTIAQKSKKRGHSSGFSIRFKAHMSNLRLKKHRSKKLQQMVDSNGIEGIRFEIIEILEREFARDREIFYISTMKPILNSVQYFEGKQVFSKEFRESQGKINKGRKLTKEQREKISVSKRGKSFGTRTRISPFSNVEIKNWERMRKPVVQLTMDGVLIREWISTSKAGEELKINRGNISSCLSGKRRSAGGYIWKYKNNKNNKNEK